MPPTIVLVHGAFAESASWDRVIDQLHDAGHDVIAAANPLRGLASDAAVGQRPGPHDRRPGRARRPLLRRHGDLERRRRRRRDRRARLRQRLRAGRRRELLRARGHVPGQHARRATVRPVPRSDGTTDLYIDAERFHDLFCADVPAPRPLGWPPRSVRRRRRRSSSRSGERPLWKELPSWFLIGEEDRNIPAALQH